MNSNGDIKSGSYRKSAGATKKETYAELYRRFILLTLICSVFPLILVGWGIYTYYSEFATARMVDYFQNLTEYHRKIVELFLKERTADLQLTAFTHSLEHLRDTSNLNRVFNTLNREEVFFTDIGVIDDRGRHVSYVGPYDLMDKDYSETFWFKRVMERGVYISDMFMGYRSVPHFIIAVLRSDENQKWILRATVYTDYMRSLVEDVKIGETGEVYLLNKEGVFQTAPRYSGKIMGSAPFRMDVFTEESGIHILEGGKDDLDRPLPKQIIAYAWLKKPRWLLGVKQDYDEAFRAVNHANHAILIFLHVSILAILVVAILTTRHMIKVIQKRDEEEERLSMQLLQASKLASIGELAAGVAHEINNPLSVILTENQVIRDLGEEATSLDGDFKGQLFESLSQIEAQVQRCSHITQNLLRFSRRSKSKIEMVDINKCCEEVIELLEKRAQTSGIQFIVDLENDLPRLLSDPFQLEQVLINFISNSIDAHEGKPYGTIRINSRLNSRKQGIEINISDTGSGISQENLKRIFDPFFTTKPVGKGTGLGLSISYTIVKSLGGNITVRSEMGKGTEFTIFLPFRTAKDFEDSPYDVAG
ncbi:MAG: ATP-binding protein [Syntrophobacteraceae bacterium]|nr:ATP-binding protein [Syntrophobacteraceae bacterium]